MKELLLLLCRYPFDADNRKLLSKLLGEIQDWNELVRLINAHGIIALACYNIKEAGLENEIPAEAMAILENGHRQSVVRNIWLTERWKEVNDILENAGIKHILLKGMALEHTLYGSQGLRQMSDCDILVKPEDSLKAWHLLQSHGFSHDLIKSPLHKKMLTMTGKHLPSLTRDGFMIEIHHDLPGIETSENMAHIFDTAVEFSIGDVKAMSLSNEMQLKYLKSHFERHKIEGNCQLRLYTDIILLDKASDISFPEGFILNPNQESKSEFRRAAYKMAVKTIPSTFRLKYLIGDIFPSVKWMKKRYNCNGLRLFYLYPMRLGKLRWLL